MSTGCPAIDQKTKTRCGQPIRRREWCYRHWKEQKNHYDSYKYDSDAYARFDNTTICTDYDHIAACADSSQLARWARQLMMKRNLCRRAIDSRKYHHNRFFGGGDDAHLRFINELCEERTFMDSVFDAIARRYDELSVANLPTEPDRDPEEVEAVMQYHDDTPTSAHDKRAELLERLFSFRKFERLHKDDPERWTRFVDFMERIIIQTLRRRAGIRPLLDCLGATPDLSLHAFLADESVVTFEELQQIYVAVHLMHPRYVLRSISDAFRSTEDPHIFILGRRIFEEPTLNPCLDAWDMFEDFMPARGWAIHAAPTLSAWIEVDRIVALGLRFPSWQPPYLDVDAGPTPASIVFPLCRTFIQYEWERASGQISRKSKKEWMETDRRAALFLKFSKSALLFFQRVVGILQAHPQFFGVLPIASGHFRLDSALLVEATRIIPSTPNVLNTGQRRQANGKGKLKDAEWVDLPYFDRRDFGEKFTGRGPFALSDPAGVLHLLVTDCMDVGEDQLRDHVAAILLAVHIHDWDGPPVPEPYRAFLDTASGTAASQAEFFRSEMRNLCNPTTAPALGRGQEGLVAIAAGTIHVNGDSFRRFRARLTQILERHADADLVRRWNEKKLQRKRKDAIRCWERHKSKLERIACLRHFFFLGTTDGHDELKKRLGREISRVEDADQLYDEDLYDHVSDSALSRAREAEKMMPPREEPADWDNELSYCEPEEIICEFEFMKEFKSLPDQGSARIVELDL